MSEQAARKVDASPARTTEHASFTFVPTVRAMHQFLTGTDGLYSVVAAMNDRRPGVPLTISVEYAQAAAE